MVVAIGGCVQNASFPTRQNNTNMNNMEEENKMVAKALLLCRDNSHPFQDRTLSLEQPVKVGRSVARVRPTPTNAIFDCKVLSRNHALLWYTSGKFYLQDTHSSNGTFINNQRLSASGMESTPKEICSGDIVQFGVDVMESTKKVTHGCIVATIKLYLPDGKEAKASLSTSVISPADNITLEDLYKLNQVMQEASRREKALYSKLSYLQQLVENTRKASNQSWKALIAEDRLLSWVDTIENQLAVYSKNYTEDIIRNELVRLHEEKAQYQNAAKEALQKILQEKLEVTQRLVQLESRLSETEEECQSLHSVTKYTQLELQELSIKYTDVLKKLQDSTNKLMESEEAIKDTLQQAEEEKQDILNKLEEQTKITTNLQARLHNSRLDSVSIYKQITALKNYMQALQDMNPKLIQNDVTESKDEVNPIDAINLILNKLISMHMDNSEVDAEINFYSVKGEQDNQINLEDANVDEKSMKQQLDDSVDNDNLPDYIVPPGSRRTLVNGNATIENQDIHLEYEIHSDTTDETSSVTSEDISEKSVIENKKEEFVSEANREVLQRMEVRFASGENGEQLEVHYELDNVAKEKETLETANERYLDTHDKVMSNEFNVALAIEKREKRDESNQEKNDLNASDEGEHLEGDYVKTLKPICKNDTMQQGVHSREYILHTLIDSLNSLTGEDSLEAQQVVRRELEELRDWLMRESNETVVDKLKELYYRTKNETQRMQEVNEELVILKEKYNKFIEEKAELTNKYMTLKAQCGNLLNATYTVPIHYVALIVLALIWMLLEKIF